MTCDDNKGRIGYDGNCNDSDNANSNSNRFTRHTIVTITIIVMILLLVSQAILRPDLYQPALATEGVINGLSHKLLFPTGSPFINGNNNNNEISTSVTDNYETTKIPNQYIVILRNNAATSTPLLPTFSTPNTANNLHLIVDNIAKRTGAQVLDVYQHTIKGFTMKTSPNVQALDIIKNDPNVALVEQDQKVHLFSQTVPTGIKRVGAEPGVANSSNITPISLVTSNNNNNNNITTSAVNASIAFLDTGIDLSHPDLNVFRQVSFVANTQSANDDNGHGTHVAGIAAAKDNGVGVVGVAPGARLWAIKVLDSSGTGSISDIISGIDYVTQHAKEIDAVNLSFGCECKSEALDSAINDAAAKGVTFVAAAGNSHKDASTFSPANNPNVIAVSAIVDTDGRCGGLGSPTTYGSDDTFASFSNFGSTVAIAAPGVNIMSTYKDGSYATMSGTSVSTPHVTGAVALYKISHHLASESEVRNALVSMASNPSTVCDGDGHGYFTGEPNDGTHEPLLYVKNLVPAVKDGNESSPTTAPPAPTPQPTQTPESQISSALCNTLSSAINQTSNLPGNIGLTTRTSSQLSSLLPTTRLLLPSTEPSSSLLDPIQNRLNSLLELFNKYCGGATESTIAKPALNSTISSLLKGTTPIPGLTNITNIQNELTRARPGSVATMNHTRIVAVDNNTSATPRFLATQNLSDGLTNTLGNDNRMSAAQTTTHLDNSKRALFPLGSLDNSSNGYAVAVGQRSVRLNDSTLSDAKQRTPFAEHLLSEQSQDTHGPINSQGIQVMSHKNYTDYSIRTNTQSRHPYQSSYIAENTQNPHSAEAQSPTGQTQFNTQVTNPYKSSHLQQPQSNLSILSPPQLSPQQQPKQLPNSPEQQSQPYHEPSSQQIQNQLAQSGNPIGNHPYPGPYQQQPQSGYTQPQNRLALTPQTQQGQGQQPEQVQNPATPPTVPQNPLLQHVRNPFEQQQLQQQQLQQQQLQQQQLQQQQLQQQQLQQQQLQQQQLQQQQLQQQQLPQLPRPLTPQHDPVLHQPLRNSYPVQSQQNAQFVTPEQGLQFPPQQGLQSTPLSTAIDRHFAPTTNRIWPR
jgi:subtilisin family serine protease